MSTFRHLSILFFFSITALSAENEVIDKTLEHLKSGAILGKNMTNSKDEIAFQIIDNMAGETKNYCLEVGNKKASEKLVTKLRARGHKADMCEGVRIVKYI